MTDPTSDESRRQLSDHLVGSLLDQIWPELGPTAAPARELEAVRPRYEHLLQRLEAIAKRAATEPQFAPASQMFDLLTRSLAREGYTYIEGRIVSPAPPLTAEDPPDSAR
jgi:hypothetical protein